MLVRCYLAHVSAMLPCTCWCDVTLHMLVRCYLAHVGAMLPCKCWCDVTLHMLVRCYYLAHAVAMLPCTCWWGCLSCVCGIRGARASVRRLRRWWGQRAQGATLAPAEAECLDKIQIKVFLLANHSHLYIFALRIYIYSNSRNLLQFLQFIYSTV